MEKYLWHGRLFLALGRCHRSHNPLRRCPKFGRRYAAVRRCPAVGVELHEADVQRGAETKRTPKSEALSASTATKQHNGNSAK